MTVRFTHSCPTCGRRIQIRACLIGRVVACQHCHAEFIARTGKSAVEAGAEAMVSDDPLMARVEQALKRAKAQSVVA